MILSMSTGRKIVLFFSFLLLSTFLYSQTVPEELDAARNEIQRAIDLGAENNASDDLKEAQRLLDEADQKFSEGDTDAAVSSANSASEAAVRAGMTSAPIYVNELKESAEKAIKDLETKGAPEESVASVKKTYAEGEAFLKSASDASASENTSLALESYRQAGDKFTESFDAADAGAASAPPAEESGEDALSLKANEIEVRIGKAKEYGAAGAAPEELQAAEAALAEANTALDEGKSEEAAAKLNTAEEKTDAALEKSMSAHAEKKKNEAEAEVASARAVYEKENVQNATIQDYLNAANEALQSAKDRIAEQQYEESIKDSAEALNLARVLKEQIAGGDVAEASPESDRSTPYGGGPGGGSAATSGDTGSTAAPAQSAWKEYTVKNKRPSDCLWRIAAYDFHYGKGKYWKKIYEANKDRIKNPNIIHPGMVLRIPPIPGTTGFPEDQPSTDTSIEDDSSAIKEESEAVETDTSTAEDDEATTDDHSPRESPAAVEENPENVPAIDDESSPEESEVEDSSEAPQTDAVEEDSSSETDESAPAVEDVEAVEDTENIPAEGTDGSANSN